ncbi:MAG: penicillin-binding protein 2, partial [Actinomycetota bacterium]|nr:penicillin-binding protein 2 [Actinomycetota bacterium]
MGVSFVAIVMRLTWLQGIGPNQYLAVGSSEWTHTVTLASERGSIVDRSGNELAISIPQTTLYADPHQVTDPGGEAARLAPALGQTSSLLDQKLTEHNHFTYLARTVSDATAAEVKAMTLPGVYTLSEPKRFYPAGQLARPLVGVTGTDGTGLGGLESKYQAILEGQPGKLVEETDPSGHQITGGLQQYQAPVAGQDLVLTLDNSLQYDAEQAVAQAIVAANAKSGIAVLMDRRTGDILADAQLSMPGPGTSTSPAVPVEISPPAGTAPAVMNGTQPVEAASASSFTQVYEPGSVNKLITISGALQQGSITPSSTFTIPNTYDVAGTPIHDAETHATEHWNVTDILANSSNIGTLQIAQKLGKTGILNTISSFGEGKRTDIGFPGESAGLLPTYWSGTTLADVSFGQGIGVTAMQVLGAYNAIANDGVYVAPRLVAGTIDKTGAE